MPGEKDRKGIDEIEADDGQAVEARDEQAPEPPEPAPRGHR